MDLKKWFLLDSGGGAAIQNVSAPVIQGNHWEEGLLYADDGEWKGRPFIFSYQWKRNGVAIDGATMQKYIPVNADVGEVITRETTASDGTNSATVISTAGTIVDMYPTKVLSYSPFAYFRLNDAGLTTADNFQGNASYDGTYGGAGWAIAGQAHTKDGFLTNRLTSSAGHVNIYSALNGGFDGNHGSVVCWVRSNSAAEWDAAFGRLFYAYADNANRIQISRISSVVSFRRFAGGADKQIDVDYSVSQPTEWLCFAMTWDTSAGGSGELKAYVNGVQVGTTQTSIGTFSGSLDSTQCCIGATNTTNGNNWRTSRYADFSFYATALGASAITDLATRPTGKYWYHSIEKTYDINSLFSVTGRSFARFYYDVDNDGEWELIVSLGGQARWAAIKDDNTIVWDVTYDSNVLDTARHPFIKNGILYQTHGTTLYAIRLTDGSKLWSTLNVPNNDLRGGNDYLICQTTFTMSLYNYSDGTIANTVTLPYGTGTQTLSFGDIDGDGLDEYFTNDYNGRIMARDHDLTELFTTIQYDNTHIDYMVVIGTDKLLAVIDTDGSVSEEGDEVVLINRSGTVTATYQSTGEQVQMRVLPEAINGVKIVGKGISGGTEAWGIDEDLVEVFSGGQMHSRNDLAKIAGDVMCYSPDTENPIDNSEIHVVDIRNGEAFKFYHEDSGIELDIETSTVIDAGFVLGGGDANHEFVTPYVLREILIGDINTLSTGNDILRKHQWTLEDIP